MLVKMLKEKKMVASNGVVIMKAGDECEIPEYLYKTWEKENIAVAVENYDPEQHKIVENALEGVDNAIEQVKESTADLEKTVDIATEELSKAEKKAVEAEKKAKEAEEKAKAEQEELERLIAEEQAKNGGK